MTGRKDFTPGRCSSGEYLVKPARLPQGWIRFGAVRRKRLAREFEEAADAYSLDSKSIIVLGTIATRRALRTATTSITSWLIAPATGGK